MVTADGFYADREYDSSAGIKRAKAMLDQIIERLDELDERNN